MMIRRCFSFPALWNIVPLTLLAAPLSAPSAAGGPAVDASYSSSFISVQLAADQPALVALSVDSLGKNKLLPSPLRTPAPCQTRYALTRTGDKLEYRSAAASSGARPAWTFEFSTRKIRLHSSYSEASPPPALLLNFNLHLNPA